MSKKSIAKSAELAELSGADYVALCEISCRNDADEIVLAAVAGQTCERVWPDSLGWLLALGHIRLATDAAVVDGG